MAVPERTAPAECYYDAKHSAEYHENSRIARIQPEITERALELLGAASPSLILDLGCGSGLSGAVLARHGHAWIGVDIAPEMLAIAQSSCNDKNVGGSAGCSVEMRAASLLLHDIGEPLPLREESVDYAISISAIQWLLESFKSEHNPRQRVRTFFRSLYRVVRVRAVLQFYCPPAGLELLRAEAAAAGFHGGLVIDEEGTKNCKQFLVISKTRARLPAGEAGCAHSNACLADARVQRDGRSKCVRSGARGGRAHKERASRHERYVRAVNDDCTAPSQNQRRQKPRNFGGR